MAVISCKETSKWYGDVIAVNDLTVDVQAGITGLLGPNGAGKSTLIRMAMGLARPSRGTVEVLGEDPWDNPKLMARIGYVPEGDAPWRENTGRRTLVLAARLTGLSGAAADEAADRSLKRIGLTAQGDKRVNAYSRGMRQRLKLGIALLNEPELLILDEPLLGADPPTRRDLLQMIRGMAQEGRSVVVSTHVLPDVEVMTKRILLMNHGRLMAHGEVAEIRDLLERYPRTVRIATPQPRELGALLWTWDSVLSVQAEEGAVIVRTRQPQQFFAALQELLAAKDVPFTSILPLDENLEAIFRYLVEPWRRS